MVVLQDDAQLDESKANIIKDDGEIEALHRVSWN